MYQNSGAINSAFTGIAGTGTSGLQNGIGTGTSLDANRIKAGLPINFFMPNPAVAQGNAYMETNGGNTRYNAMQIELRRRMSQGLLVQGSYSYAFGRKTWSWTSLRDDTWHYVPSTGSPDHAFKLNWVYELPFGQGKKWGSGAGTWLNAVIGGWEWDGVTRVQTGDKFNYGGFRLVGMSEDEFQDIFKFYHETGADGKERIYLFPQDVIQNSILALYTGVGHLGHRVRRRAADRALHRAGQRPGLRAVPRRFVPWHGRDPYRHGAHVLEGRHELREAVPAAAADGRRGAHGPLQRVRHHQLHRERLDRAGQRERNGQHPGGVAGYGCRDGRERVAGSGRPHHLVRSAVHLVRV